MSLSDGVRAAFDFIRDRKTAYQIAMSQPGMAAVLQDLSKFCHAHETCTMLTKDGMIDRDLTLMREGRREVWLRIQQHLNLSPKQLYALYTGQQYNPGDE